MEELIKSYKSRRNSACLVKTPEGQAVVKTFAEVAAFQKELEIYRLLRDTALPCARVIRAENNTLVLSQLPGITLVDCLEQQEKSGRPHWDVWDKLVAWLTAFTRHTGLIMSDVNLRNFLYDGNTLYGLDFEECCRGSIASVGARVAAFIRTYQPENTPLKQEISQYVLQQFACSCGLDPQTLHRESKAQEALLLQRRQK